MIATTDPVLRIRKTLVGIGCCEVKQTTIHFGVRCTGESARLGGFAVVVYAAQVWRTSAPVCYTKWWIPCLARWVATTFHRHCRLPIAMETMGSQTVPV